MASTSAHPVRRFKGFDLWSKIDIGACLLMGLVCFILSVVAIANKAASASSFASAAQQYMFAGGLLGMIFSVLLFSGGSFLYYRSSRNITKNKRLVRIVIYVLLALAIIFSFSAVGVASGY